MKNETVNIDKVNHTVEKLHQQINATQKVVDTLITNMETTKKQLHHLTDFAKLHVRPEQESFYKEEHPFLTTLSMNYRLVFAFVDIERLAIAGDLFSTGVRNLEHIYTVAAISEFLYQQHTNCSKEEGAFFGFASMLHDIGKMIVASELIANKKKNLLEDENNFKQHTVTGYHFLKNSLSKTGILGSKIALTHHERWNGSGYPNKLVGDQIPLEGRIVGVSDSFDSFTATGPDNKKPREKLSSHEIKTFFIKGRGVLFCPKTTDILLENFDKIKEIQQQAIDFSQKAQERFFDFANFI